MIAAALDPWKFQSEYKQRVADYFKANPTGNYDDFQKVWRRAGQVNQTIFNEVYTKLQKVNAIPMIEGGKAHAQLSKELEKKIRAELEVKQAKLADLADQAKTPPAPTPPISIHSSTPPKETVMAKEYILSEILPEERKLHDEIWQRNPNIAYEDLNTKLGFRIKKTVYYATKSSIKRGLYNYAGINGGSQGKHSTPVAPRVSNSGPVNSGHIPFVNYTKINGPQILGQVDTVGMTKEEVKFCQTKLPSILTMILHKQMTFKVFKFSSYEDEQEVDLLEFRRIL